MVRALAWMVQGPDCRDWKSSPRLNSAAKVDNPLAPLAPGLALSMHCSGKIAVVSTQRAIRSAVQRPSQTVEAAVHAPSAVATVLGKAS